MDKHLLAKGVLGHRQAGDVVLVAVVVEFLDLVEEALAGLGGKGLGGERQVDGDGPAVLGDQGALEQRVVHGQVADLQAALLIGGGVLHQPFETDLSGAGLDDGLGVAGGDDVLGHHPFVRILGAVEGGGEIGEDFDILEGARVEDAVGVFFIDHAEDQDVVEVELLFDLVVEDPDRLVGGKHVFRVGVHLDLDDEGRQQQGEDDADPDDALGVVDGDVGKDVVLH